MAGTARPALPWCPDMSETVVKLADLQAAPPFELSAEERVQIQSEIAHYPDSRAASIGAPANPPAYEYPPASPNARAVAVAFERPAPGDQPQ